MKDQMSKLRRKKTPSAFKIKQMQTFKVIPPDEDAMVLANLRDPRLTREDGGRVRPVYYDDGYRMTFEPK
jgi:hypothetical protein